MFVEFNMLSLSSDRDHLEYCSYILYSSTTFSATQREQQRGRSFLYRLGCFINVSPLISHVFFLNLLQKILKIFPFS